jgi:plasmid stabilization system protein ParE
MAYEIRVSPRAQIEIEEAQQFYKCRSTRAAQNFFAAVSKAYETLAIQPHFRKQYKEVRAINLQRFPFALFFTIEEEMQLVYILSCFHFKRNPQNRP